MSNQLTFYRKANVSSKEATDELLAAHPGHSVSLEVELATNETARHARADIGDLIYVATLKQAEGPEPEFGGADDGPSEDSAPEAPEGESDSDIAAEAKEEGESFEHEKKEKEEGDSDDKPAEKSDSKPKEPGESKMKPEEEMVHLLKQILDAVSGGAGLGGPDKDPLGPPEPHGAGPDLPGHPKPVGPPPGGPGAGAGPGGPALPPPVDKAPPGAAFASVREASAFSVVREQANELGIRGIKAEAESMFPTHRVAKIKTTGFARIDGEEIYLPEARLAVIELTRR